MPKIVDPEERRLAITEAAAQEIALHGIGGVRLTSVAKRAGWTTGVLTHYFKSKDELLATALEYTLQMMIDAGIREGKKFEGPVLKAFYAWLPRDKARKQVWKTWLSFAGWAEFAEIYKSAHETFYKKVTKATREALRAAVENGEVRSDIDIDIEADALIAFIDGIGARVALGGKGWSADRQVKLLDHYFERLRG